MGQILVGTCSWTDRTLVDSGLFYPVEVKSAEARLRFYADNFPIVEVDSTYYAIPSQRTAGLWVERTPNAFVFDVKAFRIFTQHPTPARALRPPGPALKDRAKFALVAALKGGDIDLHLVSPVLTAQAY